MVSSLRLRGRGEVQKTASAMEPVESGERLEPEQVATDPVDRGRSGRDGAGVEE